MSGGLRRYVLIATLARGADGGAPVGLVLLAVAPAAHLSRPSLVGGLLVTCMSAPHVLGPVVARRLDRARDGRRLLAAAFAVYGLALAAATCLLGRAPVGVVAGLVTVAGICGPLLIGGLSSRLAGLVEPDERAQRRAQGWDAVSYGVAGSAGPAAVAGLAAAAGPVVALLVLAATALCAAALVPTLPAGNALQVPTDEVLPVRRTLALIGLRGPLRRVAYATMMTAIPGGAVAILAVATGRQFGTGAAGGALLAAGYGFGNFLGSLAVTAFPLRGEPETLVRRFVVLVGLGFGLCAVAPDYPLALLAFGLVGAVNAPFFTATLAARSAYSPPAARAQVFVSMAGLKVGAASVGTALAGALLGAGPRLLLLAGGALALLTAAVTLLDRRLAPPARVVTGDHAG